MLQFLRVGKTCSGLAFVLLTPLIITCSTTVPSIANAEHSKSSGCDSSGSNDSGNSKQTPTQTPTEQQRHEIATPTESGKTND
ncbi:MAG: hypothetical protein WA395_07305 [Nitrososphaeraceae archaeon]